MTHYSSLVNFNLVLKFSKINRFEGIKLKQMIWYQLTVVKRVYSQIIVKKFLFVFLLLIKNKVQFVLTENIR